MTQRFNTPPPNSIRVPKEKMSLFLQWSDEEEVEISASRLRDQCRSAGTLSIAVKGLAVPARDDLFITDVQQIGSYALNISFSDGQERGIYPWELLRAIALNDELQPAQ